MPTDDLVEEDLSEFFKKYGVLKLDKETGNDCVKLYRDEHGNLKGDARVGFAKMESVQIAIEMANQSVFRPKGFRNASKDFTVSISQA